MQNSGVFDGWSSSARAVDEILSNSFSTDQFNADFPSGKAPTALVPGTHTGASLRSAVD
jgi:hypothetical protein